MLGLDQLREVGGDLLPLAGSDARLKGAVSRWPAQITKSPLLRYLIGLGNALVGPTRRVVFVEYLADGTLVEHFLHS